jgi:Uma2 family endonuclease
MQDWPRRHRITVEQFYRMGDVGLFAPDERIEISHSTLRFDREVKVPLYARHRIPELWIVDLIANELHVYREPRDGVYTAMAAEAFGQRTLVALPDVVIDLAPFA